MIFCCLYLISTSSFPFYFLSVMHSVVSPSSSSFSMWCVSLFPQLFYFIFLVMCFSTCALSTSHAFYHFSVRSVFLLLLLSCQPHSKLSTAPIHHPHPFLLLISLIWCFHSAFSHRNEACAFFLMSRTYAHWLALCWALFSLSDTHSCYCGKTASADASLSFSVWSPYLSLCLIYDHLKHNKNHFFFPSLLSFQTFPLCLYFPVPRTILLNNTQPQLVSRNYSHLLHH